MGSRQRSRRVLRNARTVSRLWGCQVPLGRVWKSGSTWLLTCAMGDPAVVTPFLGGRPVADVPRMTVYEDGYKLGGNPWMCTVVGPDGATLFRGTVTAFRNVLSVSYHRLKRIVNARTNATITRVVAAIILGGLAAAALYTGVGAGAAPVLLSGAVRIISGEDPGAVIGSVMRDPRTVAAGNELLGAGKAALAADDDHTEFSAGSSSRALDSSPKADGQPAGTYSGSTAG